MKLTCVVGARPNFIKTASIVRAAAAQPEVQLRLVHTGQHYDQAMSATFFEDLDLPPPHSYLNAGSGSHAVQTARVLSAFDAELDRHPPDWVMVVGDVNSTLACALAAAKRGIRVAHVEAGLRSGDRTMPEEINRVLTDQLADLLFTTERGAAEHLRREGIADRRIHFVGNVMIDTLFQHRARARASTVLTRLACRPRHYALCTVHRPSNVDTVTAAENTVCAIEAIAARLPVIFPAHPRTQSALERFGLRQRLASRAITIVEPLGYLDFLALMDHARLVFTDSGGVQEETTALGVPCLTFRRNTERPVTVTSGTNHLVGLEPACTAAAVEALLREGSPEVRLPELWDGHAAERILDVLIHDGVPAMVL